MPTKTQKKPLRKLYSQRLLIRCLILVASILLVCFNCSQFEVLSGMQFFKKLSFLHPLWLIWVFDMLTQLFPSRQVVSLGSQKLFRRYYCPADRSSKSQFPAKALKAASSGAYAVFGVWAALIAALGFLYYLEILEPVHLFLITVVFYVCDLICVLFWCPFRVFFLKNRCCTTCRIFNWDHLMMFSPMIYIKSFFSWSLLGLSILVWGVWEIAVFRHPERFFEQTNQALQCSECTDLLCGKRLIPQRN